MVRKTDLDILLSNDFKLIALDIDGTLITGNHILTNRTMEALKAVKEAGIKITIATGRHYWSAVRIAQKIGINAPLICSDGAIIRDMYSGKTMFQLLPKEIAVDILRIASDYKNFRIQVFTRDGKIYAGHNYRQVFLKNFLHAPFRYSLKGYYNLFRDFVFVPVKNTGNIDGTIKALKKAPAKLVVRGDGNPEGLRNFTNRIAEKYGDEISMTTAIINCVDILKGGVSKARGISTICKGLGISREQIITVGDNINDIEMLEYAGLGVAMGNAPDEVKARADYVTSSNNDEGLARFLEKLLSAMDDTDTLAGYRPKLFQSKFSS